ncbi:NAD(P)H-hydrate epimerase, partial [Desulfovibrio sp.]
MNGKWWSALPPLPLPHEMQQWDKQAVELGILPEILMENAAAAAFRQLSALCPRLAGKQVWLLMGSGNNGGDAACLARYLLDAGACPHVFHTRPLEHYRNETAYHLRTALTCGVPFLPVAALTETPLPHPDILVDGLLGTGFSGQLRDDARRLVSFVNELSPRPLILSLDVPSGLDATSGLPCPEAVKADMTVSFAAAKPGLMLPWARPYTGECHVGPIAMPAKVREEGPCSFRLLDGHALTLLPAMTAASYKNTYGHILVMGGRPGMCGAGHLAARGALRSGAGLVTAAMPAAGEDQVRMGWPEIMTLPLGDPGNRDWPAQLPDDLRQRLHQCRALVIGPGMGRGEDSHAFLAALLKEP